jgi:hypothetical protein
MTALPHDAVFSAHTVPIWKAYCEKHGYDFFLQEESLVTEGRPHWTNIRVLMELIHMAKWKYAWLVLPQSLPTAFETGWQILVKDHLRKVRFKDDHQKERMMWCPEECPKEFKKDYEDGACYGPRISGCIFWKKHSLEVLYMWYQQRKNMQHDVHGLEMGLKSIRKHSYWDLIFISPVQNLIGFPDSTFLATHKTREEVMATIGRKKIFGEILNKHGEYKPGAKSEL